MERQEPIQDFLETWKAFCKNGKTSGEKMIICWQDGDESLVEGSVERPITEVGKVVVHYHPKGEDEEFTGIVRAGLVPLEKIVSWRIESKEV